MKPISTAGVLLLLLAGVTAGCGLVRSESYPSVTPPRPATDLPDRFEPTDPSLRLEAADTLVGGGCLTPMVDPRDGAELWLERSGRGRGDYRVPGSRYGVGPRELLQLDCNTGRPFGIVDA